MRAVIILAVLLVGAFKASAQDLYTTNVSESESILVPNGHVAEVIFASGGIKFWDGSNSSFSEPVYFNQSSKFPIYFTGGLQGQTANMIYGASPTKTIVTYRIISNVAVGSPTTNYIPASAVVIPADSAGSVRIILESSADLITWTEANPGLYGSSSSKRFFRVRAVNQ